MSDKPYILNPPPYRTAAEHAAVSEVLSKGSPLNDEELASLSEDPWIGKQPPTTQQVIADLLATIYEYRRRSHTP